MTVADRERNRERSAGAESADLDGGSGGWLVAVDVGGTFTDVTMANPLTGEVRSVKTSTDPDDPSIGFERGIRMALERSRVPPSSIERTYHATTIATNAVLEAGGAPTALLTTDGFRHVLEIGRHDGPRRTPLLHWVKPARPVAPDRIFEVGERVSPTGAIEIPLDERGVREIAARLPSLGVESVAVCLINGYANPEHERAVRQIVRDACPGLAVSISSDVLPVFREYERAMATILNATVMPLMSGYLGRLEDCLAAIGIAPRLLVMQSNGGLARPADVRDRPAWTVLSGPAAGVLGAARLARAAGFADVISLDVGGTSTDVALVRSGEPEVTEEGSIGPWPLALPMLDVHTVGAGGGSIASVRADGSLAVGPRSAGSRPGPACYRLGGERPTVTDAQLLLGRIPDRLAAGTVELDRARALEVVRTEIAEPLGLDPFAAACGIVEIADEGIAAAIRLITTERGHDPRAHALVAGGGAGPLHAAAVSDLLGISTVLVPAAAGVLATIGLLVTDLRREFVRTHVAVLDGGSLAAIRGVARDLEAEAAAWFVEQGIPTDQRALAWHASLRYPEQASELLIKWPTADRLEPAALGELIGDFHRRHRERYGYDLPASPVEFAALRVQATADVPRLELPVSKARAGSGSGRRGQARSRRREVYVDRRIGFERAVVVDGDAVPARGVVGPAVIERADSTVYVPPAWRARADGSGNVILVREAPR